MSRNPLPVPGLHLPHRTLHRINGPVSMYYLKPKEDVWQARRKEGIELPLMLLWGDIHQYRTGMCEDCACAVENESKGDCCVPLHDPLFLKEIDELAKHTPIDFYTELSRDMRSFVGHHGDILFGDFIRKTTIECHDVPLRSKHAYESKCPTQRIRWHYVDARFMRNAAEGFIIQPVREWVNDQIQRITENPSATPSTLGDHLLLDDDYDPEFIEGFPSQTLPVNRALLSTLFDSDEIEDTTRFIAHQIIDSLGTFRARRQSVIFKQLDRIPFLKWMDVEVWKEWMVSNLLQMPLYLSAFDAFQAIPVGQRKALRRWMEPALTYELSSDRTHGVAEAGNTTQTKALLPALHALHQLLLIVQTKIMDLYFMGRLLKSPRENVTGTLALGFFGDYHTRSIVDLLSLPVFGYNIQVIQATDLVQYNDPRMNRCVTIRTPIRLVEDVMAHHRMRFPTANNEWRIGLYHKKLANEQSRRNQNRAKPQTARKRVNLSSLNAFLGIKKGGRRRNKTRRVRQ